MAVSYRPIKIGISLSRYNEKVTAQAHENYQQRQRTHWSLAQGLLGLWDCWSPDPQYVTLCWLAEKIAEADAQTGSALRDWLMAEREIVKNFEILQQRPQTVHVERFNNLVARMAHSIWFYEEKELAHQDWMCAVRQFQKEGKSLSTNALNERAHQLWLARKDANAAWNWQRAVWRVSDEYMIAE